MQVFLPTAAQPLRLTRVLRLLLQLPTDAADLPAMMQEVADKMDVILTGLR
jgi:hypothetical protein